MGQTPAGAKKAQETIRQRYGSEFFKIRAAKGGRSSTTQYKKGELRASKQGLEGAAKRWSKK